MRYLLALALFATLCALVPTSVHAQSPCDRSAITQFDMSGVYRSDEQNMVLVVYPCGGIAVIWMNVYGEHGAAYQTIKRVPGEGVIATIMDKSPEKLDASIALGVKAAEPGWVQLMTVNQYTDELRTYRLRKAS